MVNDQRASGQLVSCRVAKRGTNHRKFGSNLLGVAAAEVLPRVSPNPMRTHFVNRRKRRWETNSDKVRAIPVKASRTQEKPVKTSLHRAATGPIKATKEIPVRAANPDLWEQFQILGHAGNRHGIGEKAYHSIHLGWDALLLRPGFGTEKNRLAVERNDPSADEVRLG